LESAISFLAGHARPNNPVPAFCQSEPFWPAYDALFSFSIPTGNSSYETVLIMAGHCPGIPAGTGAGRIHRHGSAEATGSAPGVGVPGQAKRLYTFSAHMKWMPAILFSCFASIGVHFLLNADSF
jgi:hypothetical protein